MTEPAITRPAGPRLMVLTVSYNTIGHLARLLFSLRQNAPAVGSAIVVVDNGSTDGSAELLDAAGRAGLCIPVLNDTNRYHGPALNQGLELVRSDYPQCELVWVLDSDCVLLDDQLVAELERLVDASGAALVGEEVWDRWHSTVRLGLYSLVLATDVLSDPRVQWFEESGDPAFELERSVRATGRGVVTFPFTASHRLVHVGRGTLRGVAERGEEDNRYHEWAEAHAEPHFQGVVGAAERYAAFCRQFDAVVPGLDDPAAFVAALS